MAIQISADQRTFTLQTKSSSYQMAVDAYGVLLHLYYGKKIEAENLEYLIYKSDVGFSGNPVECRKRPHVFFGLPSAGTAIQRGRRFQGGNDPAVP